MLERIIENHLKRPDRLLENGRLTFAQKLMLVHAFDVIDDASINALRFVNALRNEFAHQKGRTLTEADVLRLGQPFGKEYRDVRRMCKGDVRMLLTFTLALVARAFIAHALAPDAEAHLAEFRSTTVKPIGRAPA